MGDNRDRGIEFGDLTDDLEAESYPLSKAELVDRYGDRELEHSSGAVTLEELLVEEGDREFENADEIHETILNMVGAEAVGRQRYSDRGAGTAEQDGDDDASF
jgi:hypothetical protein